MSRVAATLIRHGHKDYDVWHSYPHHKIQGYYVEARLHEIEMYSEGCNISRVSNADAKSFKQFSSELKSTIAKLRQEVEEVEIEGGEYQLKTDSGMQGFFKSILGVVNKGNSIRTDLV